MKSHLLATRMQYVCATSARKVLSRPSTSLHSSPGQQAATYEMLSVAHTSRPARNSIAVMGLTFHCEEEPNIISLNCFVSLILFFKKHLHKTKTSFNTIFFENTFLFYICIKIISITNNIDIVKISIFRYYQNYNIDTKISDIGRKISIFR